MTKDLEAEVVNKDELQAKVLELEALLLDKKWEEEQDEVKVGSGEESDMNPGNQEEELLEDVNRLQTTKGYFCCCKKFF